MSRFGTEASDQAAPLRAFYFDCLHLDGVDLIDLSLVERRGALTGAVPDEALVGSVLTDDPEEADRFFEDAVAAGYEGVVVKDPDQPYEAGRRGSGWLKVKPTYTLDLLVLAAEWGSGRREGWLSNLHLGAADDDGGYVMLGKTFKGLTDEMLAWQTERFLEIEDHRSRNTVFLKPEIVYEIAFDGVQRSTRYPGGVALRFARVKRYRDDKGPEDADTIDTVRTFARGLGGTVVFHSMEWILNRAVDSLELHRAGLGNRELDAIDSRQSADFGDHDLLGTGSAHSPVLRDGHHGPGSRTAVDGRLVGVETDANGGGEPVVATVLGEPTLDEHGRLHGIACHGRR